MVWYLVKHRDFTFSPLPQYKGNTNKLFLWIKTDIERVKDAFYYEVSR